MSGAARGARRPRPCSPCGATALTRRPAPRSFHRLAEFSGTTRSCKRQLELHNARRRKAAKAAAAEQAGSASSVGQQPEADAAADAAATLAQVS